MSSKVMSAFLLQRMRALGFSNAALASRVGISRQTWYNILNADIKEIKLSTLINLAEVLEVRPVQLLDLYMDGRVSGTES